MRRRGPPVRIAHAEVDNVLPGCAGPRLRLVDPRRTRKAEGVGCGGIRWPWRKTFLEGWRSEARRAALPGGFGLQMQIGGRHPGCAKRDGNGLGAAQGQVQRTGLRIRAGQHVPAMPGHAHRRTPLCASAKRRRVSVAEGGSTAEPGVNAITTVLAGAGGGGAAGAGATVDAGGAGTATPSPAGGRRRRLGEVRARRPGGDGGGKWRGPRQASASPLAPWALRPGFAAAAAGAAAASTTTRLTLGSGGAAAGAPGLARAAGGVATVSGEAAAATVEASPLGGELVGNALLRRDVGRRPAAPGWCPDWDKAHRHPAAAAAAAQSLRLPARETNRWLTRRRLGYNPPDPR